jgi:excisionase family DNA binding protein
MSQPASKLVQFKDVAEHFDVSVATVRNWVKDKRIPFAKIGSVYRFKIEEIEKAITEPPNFSGSLTGEENEEENEEEDSDEWAEAQINRVTLCFRVLWIKRPDLRGKLINLIATRNLNARVTVHLMTGIPLRLKIDEIASIFGVEEKKMRGAMAYSKILMHPINFPSELEQAWHEELEKLDSDDELIQRLLNT